MSVIESVRKGPFQRTILGGSEVTFPEKETCAAASMQFSWDRRTREC